LAIENKVETHKAVSGLSVQAVVAAPIADNGPQNELTKAFTEVEWEGVKALRVSHASLS
jgi:hypothetical protein